MTGIMLSPTMANIPVYHWVDPPPLQIWQDQNFVDGVPLQGDGVRLYSSGQDPEIKRLKGLLQDIRNLVDAIDEDYESVEVIIDDIRDVLAKEKETL